MARQPRKTSDLLLTRFRRWARSVGLARKLVLGLGLAALMSGIATYLAISGNPLGPNRNLVRGLLIADGIILIILLSIVLWGLISAWLERRSGAAGSRLHVKIIGLFVGIAAVPTLIVAIFSALFFNIGLQTWFSEPISKAVTESVQVAEAYVTEHRRSIEADVLAMANELNRGAPELSRDPQLLQNVVNTLSRARSLSEVTVFERSGQVLARAGISVLLEVEKVPQWALDRAVAGEVVVLTSEYEDRVRALIRLDNYVGTYLYIGRVIDLRALDHVTRTREAVNEYRKLEASRSGLEVTFAVIFGTVALLILLAVAAFGIAIASRLVRPISSMIDAAGRIREGDYTARVSVGFADDEMGALGRAFNRMTMQLSEQRSDLIDANRQLDERRRFTEAVLAGVSAGVIGISLDGRIELINPSAVRLLGRASIELSGKPLGIVAREFMPLLAEAREHPERQATDQVNVTRDGRLRNLAVAIVAERRDEEVLGYVVTFDDITELVSAQRTAAWADVARRIAHEIKNPLTPIQLSAERLRRKYLKEIASDTDTFNRCVDTIIRQVSDIGRMVDEFSSFARMPAPIFRQEDLVELARQAVFLQQVAHPEISYHSELPPDPLTLQCDGRQLAQVLTNLLQNAADAIEGRRAEESDAPAGRIEVSVYAQGDRAVLEVIDNGRGLPKENRHRLTEPYVTTRAKGTGLGLAIVKKITEEHSGELTLSDAPERGACVRMVFPRVKKAVELVVDQIQLKTGSVT